MAASYICGSQNQDMYLMNILASFAVASIALSSCDNAKSSVPSSPVDQDSLKTLSLANGITTANMGSKKGVVELKGHVIQPQSGKIFLWETQGKNTTKIDSAQIGGGKFSFGSKEFEQGFYMLGMNDKNMCAIILNPAEPVCEIGFKGGILEQSMYAVSSRENEGWAKYFPKEGALLKAIKDAKVGAAKNPGMKVQFDEQAKIKELELFNLQKSLIEEYPGTHLAKILTWKQEPNKTDITKYWDNIDFNDESIIRSKVLSDRIESFMRSFSKGEESGFFNCIAVVAEKAKANDRVLEFTLNQMLVGFYESNMENICTYIIDNYVNGDACGDADLSSVIKNTAESIANLSIGKTPPNISMSTLGGTTFDLYKTCASNKYTLVMFWSSWCEHCKGEAPEVKACYDQWHAKGFEIAGVSIDRNKAPWEAAVKDRGFTFPQMCGMNEYQSPVAKDYRITRTPTFFLLDKDHKIVLKPKGIKEVQDFLSSNLK
ncbi:MAG: thioredoxin-like domain-containing protein [Flavobacteriales bacterium]